MAPGFSPGLAPGEADRHGRMGAVAAAHVTADRKRQEEQGMKASLLFENSENNLAGLQPLNETCRL